MTKPWATFAVVTALACVGGSCSSEEDGDAATGKSSSASKDSEDSKDAKDADEAGDADEAKDGEDGQMASDEEVADDQDEGGDEQATADLDYANDIRGHCDLSTDFADDHACMPAPKPSEGIQIHIGPTDYDDPDQIAKFVMHPGEESSECFTFRTPNQEEIAYQTYVLSGRAGTHHIINSVYEGDLPTGSFGPCDGRNTDGVTQVGSLPGASKAYMPRSKVAPEYAHVGQTLGAEALVQADMHYYNFTDKDILREVWINLYFPPDEDTVTEYSDIIRGYGGLSWYNEPIEPGTDEVYKYECPITGDGNIMMLLGHYHSHGRRFSVSLKRQSGDIEKVFEMYDYLDPATFDYNSVTKNPKFSDSAAGAVSGILKVQDGDVLQWECHIVNDGNVPLRYTNEVVNGEMCNVWGYSIGTDPIVCDLP